MITTRSRYRRASRFDATALALLLALLAAIGVIATPTTGPESIHVTEGSTHE